MPLQDETNPNIFLFKIRNFWFWRRTSVLLVFVFLKLWLGGLCFMIIENNYLEEKYAGNEADDVERLLDGYATRFSQRQRVTKEDLMKFHSEYSSAKVSQISVQRWSLSDGVYFYMTLVTTIGFGDVVPESPEGKMLTIVLGVVGISFFGILLADCIGLQKKICVTLYRRLADNPEDSEYTDGQAMAMNTGILLFGLGFIYIIFIALPAIVLTCHTDWDLISAQYFLFVTFSTTGFGDYTLRDVSDFVGVLYLLYLVFGLAALGGLLSSMTEIFSRTTERIKMQLITVTESGVTDEVKDIGSPTEKNAPAAELN